MAPRFDPTTKTLDLAVADLLDTQLLRSLGFANRGGYERMWLGQAIHSRYQEEALRDDATYQSEVTLRHEMEFRGWRVTVHGRADGLRRADDGVLVVEEIKSVRRGADLPPASRELYERQASLYAWLLRATRPEETEVRAELLLIEIGGEAVHREAVEVNLRTVEAIVKRRLTSLLRAHRADAAAREQRHEAAGELVFPYADQRPGQQKIVDDVSRALDQYEHLLVEAPTGLGKTVAALYPALRHALAHDRRVFVLTAKTLQQDMAMTVVSLLNEGSFHSLRLRAKSKMCANDQVICHEEYCPYAKDYYSKLQRSRLVPTLLDRHDTLHPDDVFAASRRAEVCPFEVSLELGRHAQMMVCDYNYAFDPYVALTDFGPDADLSDVVLVVDEIHNLVDRGRGYWSPRLSSVQCRRAAEVVATGGAPIHRELASLCGELEELIVEHVEDLQPAGGQTSWAFEQSLPEDRLWRLRARLDRAFVDYLEFRRETKTLTADDLFVDLYFDVLKFLNALVVSDHSFSHYLERDGEDYLFQVLCKDPSRFLGAVINRCHSVIGLSATLSPYEFYRDLLGFDTQRTAELRVPNPFPAENRKVVIDSSVATRYKERPQNYPLIAERLGEFADAVPGNTLALFPSYRFLGEVATRMRTEQKRVIVQTPASGDRERDEILDKLRTAIFGDVLLLAVAGGVFAEGVDYPGEVLKAVAVVGPCLPALTLEQQLLRQYYDERFERGFEYAFVVPGMTRVVQAAGRLIRSADDRGVIALFDKRFLWRPYREHLPPDWLPAGGRARDLSGHPGEEAERFFREIHQIRDATRGREGAREAAGIGAPGVGGDEP